MKRIFAMVLTSIFFIGALGCCQKAATGAEVYSFPEPTEELTVTVYSQGQESTQTLDDSATINAVIGWFYELKLTPSEPPEEIAGGESYDFIVNGETAFTYLDYGESVYLAVEGCFYYRVKKPATPPVA